MANIFNDDIEGVKALQTIVNETAKDLKKITEGIKEANKSLKFDNVKNIEKGPVDTVWSH